MRKRTLLTAVAAGLGLVSATAFSIAPDGRTAKAAGAGSPVVVELFTSQGCHSCPPADAFLGELAKRPGLIALSYHVDYWNYLGWRDPFSSAAATKRQKSYRWTMHTRMIYTPQMVVDGRYEGVGSRVGYMDRLIAKAAKKAAAVSVVLSRAGDMLKATLSAAPNIKEADIWLVFFDKSRKTKITTGENGGKTIEYHNVVRDFRVVGMFVGKAVTLTLPAKDSSGVKRWGAALLVQMPNSGAIIGAGAVGSH